MLKYKGYCNSKLLCAWRSRSTVGSTESHCLMGIIQKNGIKYLGVHSFVANALIGQLNVHDFQLEEQVATSIEKRRERKKERKTRKEKKVMFIATNVKIIQRRTSNPGSAMGTLSNPDSSRSPGTSSIDAAFSSIDKSIMSASSTAIGGGGGARYGSIYPSGNLPPGAFCKAFSRSFCHAVYWFTACSCSLYINLVSNRDTQGGHWLEFALLILVHRFIKKIRVDFHEELQGIINHAMNCPAQTFIDYIPRKNTCDLPIPMWFRVGIQCRENNGKNNREIVAHKVDDIFVVPV